MPGIVSKSPAPRTPKNGRAWDTLKYYVVFFFFSPQVDMALP